MESKDVYKLAQIMMAAESKKKTKNIVESLRNEAYQRTFTDEYPFVKKSQPSKPIPLEQRQHWAEMARQRGD